MCASCNVRNRLRIDSVESIYTTMHVNVNLCDVTTFVRNLSVYSYAVKNSYQCFQKNLTNLRVKYNYKKYESPHLSAR